MAMKSAYKDRNQGRFRRLERATESLITHFVSSGDDLTTANGKVQELSDDIKLYLFVYVLGNTQPLIDAVNAASTTGMDSAAKTIVTDILSGSA